MLSNKTGVNVNISGGKVQNQGNINANVNRGGAQQKVGVNSPTGYNANKSFVSTANTQNVQGQRKANLNRSNNYDDADWQGQGQGQNGREGGRYDSLRANKS